MENDQICIWLFLWSTLNLKYVLCSDLDFQRFGIFFMGYSYFLFFEIPGHIICPFSFVYCSFVFGFTAASWHGIWIFHWDKWIDVFTASRFAVLFKMPSSLSWTLVPVASAILAWTRLSPDTCTAVSWTRSTASASRVGQLHSFVVVIQGVWMLFVLQRFQLLPGSARRGPSSVWGLQSRCSAVDRGHPRTMGNISRPSGQTLVPVGMSSPGPTTLSHVCSPPLL